MISAILHLLQAFAGELEFPIRCLLRFLDKSVQHYCAAANDKAIKGAPDTRFASWPQFKQRVSQRARMRQPQIRAMLHQELCDARVIGKDVRRPALYLSEHLRMKVFNGKAHIRMFSYLRTCVNFFWQSRQLHPGRSGSRCSGTRRGCRAGFRWGATGFVLGDRYRRQTKLNFILALAGLAQVRTVCNLYLAKIHFRP